MKLSTAKKKYKKHWKAMQKHLEGITCIINKKGETIIPDSDLRYAYDMVTKGESKIIWD
jgi:hypothetical protein